jgi:hypothetical protein
MLTKNEPKVSEKKHKIKITFKTEKEVEANISIRLMKKEDGNIYVEF